MRNVWLCTDCGVLFAQPPPPLPLQAAGEPCFVLRTCVDHAALQRAPECTPFPSGLFVHKDFLSVDDEESTIAFLDRHKDCKAGADVSAPAATETADCGCCLSTANAVPAGDVERAETRPVADPAAAEEEALSSVAPAAESDGGWKSSQSGRHKQDYGPQPNFKKRRVKLGGYTGFPEQLGPLIRRVMDVVSAKTESEYWPVQVSCLDYVFEGRSNLDPHIDDTWLWGDRVVGVCLVSDCVMSFLTSGQTHALAPPVDCVATPSVNATVDAAVTPHGDNIVFHLKVLLPRRCCFWIRRESRYSWLHGIEADGVLGARRVSMTFRELSRRFVNENSEQAEEISRLARASLCRTA